MTLQERLAQARAGLTEAEQLADRAEQARVEAVHQQLRMQGRIAVLEELIAEAHG